MSVIGTRMLRKEDPELLTGEGKYIDDIQVTGQLWMGMVRSTVAVWERRRVTAPNRFPARSITAPALINCSGPMSERLNPRAASHPRRPRVISWMRSR